MKPQLTPVSRRAFLKSSAAAGALFALNPISRAFAQIAAPLVPLDPLSQTKYVNALVNPLDPAFHFVPTDFVRDPLNPNARIPKFDLRIRQFDARLGLTGANGRHIATTLWGYATPLQAPTFPGRTIEVFQGTRIQVSFTNELTRNGAPLPHLLPIDTTLEWANPGNLGALAPVPLVAHLHGGDTPYLSDGLPDAWGTPGEEFRGEKFQRDYVYDNSQEAGHLWFHDHALGVTRLNVYAGLAGNYFIRGRDELMLIALRKLPAWPYEVPLVLQDRMFFDNGALNYPSDPASYPLEEGQSPLPPSMGVTHLPEFFGDVMLVNGSPWPRLDVEPRRYRFRLLNGSDSRVYELRVETGTVPGAGTPAPVFVIGNELGLLDAPVAVDLLRIAPGERYDIVVDFTGQRGRKFTLTNCANAPYPDGDPLIAGVQDQVMQFNVSRPLNPLVPNRALPANLRVVSGPLPAAVPPAGTNVRRIVLVEGTDPFGRLMTMLGPVDPVNAGGGRTLQGTLFHADPITEKPAEGSTEVWEFYNTTVDAHPLHMHLVDFRVLSRQVFDSSVLQAKDMGGGYVGGLLDPATISFVNPDGTPSTPVEPDAWERGRKDTVVAYPGQVTRVLVSFRRKGSYVYHCHILSHEDHEMMRPFEVV